MSIQNAPMESPPPTPARRRRGRPSRSSEQIEDVRTRIAACAFKLFQEEGFAAVSMRRLAQEAGCTVMTVYKYYSRKIDVLRDLWARVFSDLFDELDAVAAGHPDPAERLHAVSQAYVAFWLARRERYFLVFMSSGVTQADVSVFVHDDPQMMRFGVFRESLASALNLAPHAPEVSAKADLLMAVLHGVAHNQITISGYPWTPPHTLVRAAVDGLVSSVA
jgi:AcrR family transcriptional regulator